MIRVPSTNNVVPKSNIFSAIAESLHERKPFCNYLGYEFWTYVCRIRAALFTIYCPVIITDGIISNILLVVINCPLNCALSRNVMSFDTGYWAVVWHCEHEHCIALQHTHTHTPTLISSLLANQVSKRFRNGSCNEISVEICPGNLTGIVIGIAEP